MLLLRILFFFSFTATACAHERTVHILTEGNGAIAIAHSVLFLQAEGSDQKGVKKIKTSTVAVHFNDLEGCLQQSLARSHSGSTLLITCPSHDLGALEAHPFVIERSRSLLSGALTPCLSYTQKRPNTDPFYDNTSKKPLLPCTAYHNEQFAHFSPRDFVQWRITLLRIEHAPKVWSTQRH